MGRDHFKQSMFNPYFQSDHYQNETEAGKMEQRIMLFFKKLLRKK